MTTRFSKSSEARRLVRLSIARGEPNRDILARLNVWLGTHPVDAGLPKVARYISEMTHICLYASSYWELGLSWGQPR